MRAMAEQADAEAEEAEALAAAARARARAIQLRRQAELAEAAEEASKTTVAASPESEEIEEPSVETAAGHEPEGVGAGAQTEVIAPEVEQKDVPTKTVATDEGVEDTDESIDDTVAASAAETRAEPDASPPAIAFQPAPKRRWRGALDASLGIIVMVGSGRRPAASALAASLAIIVIVASIVASGYMVLAHRDASRQRQRAAEFAAAAKTGVVTLTSLDFNNAKKGVQDILDDSTGAFRDDFQKMAGDFTKVVEASKVIERGTVQAVAVDLDSMTNDSAVVLVASTSEVTNAAGAKQDPRGFRLIVTLTRDGDQLKMSKVEFVP